MRITLAVGFTGVLTTQYVYAEHTCAWAVYYVCCLANILYVYFVNNPLVHIIEREAERLRDIHHVPRAY